MDLQKVQYTQDGRPFFWSTVMNHSMWGKDKLKEYKRKVYGWIKECGVCGKTFFSSHFKVLYCTVSCSKKQERNSNWKGGRYESNKYIMLNIKGKKILEHRHMMEKYLGRKLESFEIIHHKNAIKTDNRIENLEIIVTQTKSNFHKGKVSCPYCLKYFFIK